MGHRLGRFCVFALLVGLLGVRLLAGTPVLAQPDMVLDDGADSGEPGDVSPFAGCNEPHTAVVSPLNPQLLAVAECNTVAVSTDFGRNFTIGFQNTNTLPAGLTAGNWGSCGDPALTFDAAGRLFWTYLLCGDYGPAPDGNTDEITVVVAQINPTTGALIGNPVDLTPGQNNDDKQWLVADATPSSPYANNLYVVWTRINTGQVMFVRSTNQGATWSAPQAISAGGEGFVWPSHVAVAPNGDVYAGYHSDTCGSPTASMFILRDSSGGANLAAGTAVQKTSFQSATTCNVQNPGPGIPNTDFWMQGAQQPWIVPDPIRPGNVYVVANDDPDDNFTTGDPGDIILERSTDNGNTWSRSTISHAPANTLQLMPTAAMDQDGKLAVFWYDTRRGILNNNGTPSNTADDYFNLDVYATVSRDGGLTFTNDFRINDAQFDPDLGAPCRFGCNASATPPDPPPATLRIGEYNGVAAANGNAYAVWTGNGGGGQALFFDIFSIDGAFPDRFEPNDSIQAGVPTDLGQHATYSEPELTIHNELDEDFYRVTALSTGSMHFELSQNPRLADLDIQVRDRFNQPIATSTSALDSNATESVTVPVVAGESYYLRVFAQPGEFPGTAVYDLNIVNTPAPVPFSIGLAPGSDSGWYANDNITNTTTPTVALLVDQTALAGLAASPSPDANAADDAPGHKVAVYVNGTFDGFATSGPGPGTYTYTLSGAPPVVQGLNSITARVFIVDPSDDPAVGGTAHVVGQGGQSDALLVNVDASAPAPPSAPDLLPTSDSGASNTDNITNVVAPAFQGTGEVNTRVRILANGVNVGEGVVGSDATDGVSGNGLGAWEVTVEPLADGTYTITAVVEDQAGNISAPSAPMAGGPLVVDSGSSAPQRPTIDLLSADDTGRSDQDNVTNKTTLRFRVSAEIGTTVVIKDGNTVIDTWVQVAAFDERSLNLAEGPHPLSAESTDTAGNRSQQSQELLVVVDATAPAAPAQADLLASSDTGGIDDDNVTTVQQPHFGGTGEPNALVRLFAGTAQVGNAVLNSSGAYEVPSSVLGDGVYNVTLRFEDLAGNLSAPSAALKVTIAHNSLTLPGGTATGPATGPVTLDLGASTIAGYPGIAGATGKVGILGIPQVTLDGGGKALNVLGSAQDDNVVYTPTTASGGTLSTAGVPQTIAFSGAASLSIDPLGGNDVVSVAGTANDDTAVVNVDLVTTARIGTTLAVAMPAASVERLALSTLAGQDTITVNAYDTVDAHVTVDAGDPATAPNKRGDQLTVNGASARAFVQNAPGGPTPGSGSATVSYPKTTNHTTRVDYSYVEKAGVGK